MSHADSADFQLVSEAGPAPEPPLAAVSVGSGDLLADSVEYLRDMAAKDGALADALRQSGAPSDPTEALNEKS